MRVYADFELPAIEYIDHGSAAPAEVFLRENIEPAPCGGWQAEQVRVLTHESMDYVTQHFDELWVRAQTNSLSVLERLDEMEDVLGAVVDTLIGEAQ